MKFTKTLLERVFSGVLALEVFQRFLPNTMMQFAKAKLIIHAFNQHLTGSYVIKVFDNCVF